jgi:hypothetical protein
LKKIFNPEQEKAERSRERIRTALDHEPGLDDLVGKFAVAKTLDVSDRTVESWRRNPPPGFPPGRKIGNSKTAPVRWRWGDIVDYREGIAQGDAA